MYRKIMKIMNFFAGAAPGSLVNLKKMMSPMKYTILALLLVASFAQAEESYSTFKGAKLVAQDSYKTYLGKISNSYDRESIFNEHGVYGNKYNSSSIWNEYSMFGNEHNPYSPFNEYSHAPPEIIKDEQIIGYLSMNKCIRNSISPASLRSLYESSIGQKDNLSR